MAADLAMMTCQAAERAQMAEEKASAAVMAIGMIETPEQRKIKLNSLDAEKCWPEPYTADRVDKKSISEFLGEVETYLSVHQAHWRDRCWNGLPPSATRRS